MYPSRELIFSTGRCHRHVRTHRSPRPRPNGIFLVFDLVRIKLGQIPIGELALRPLVFVVPYENVTNADIPV